MSTENAAPAEAQPEPDRQTGRLASAKPDAKDTPCPSDVSDNAGSRNDGKEYGTAKTPAGGAHSNPSRQDDTPKKPTEPQR